jgi:hypothetical protein
LLEQSRTKSAGIKSRESDLPELQRKLETDDDWGPDELFALMNPKTENLSLMAFERRGGLTVITFAYRDPYENVPLISDTQRALFGVVLKYMRLPDSRTMKIMRKTANLPLVHSLLPPEAGTAWRIALVDFRINGAVVDLLSSIAARRTSTSTKARKDLGDDPKFFEKLDQLVAIQTAKDFESAQAALEHQFASLSRYFDEEETLFREALAKIFR